jgi:hypothetical protein
MFRVCLKAGLPDGIHYFKPKILILDFGCLEMENVDVLYSHWEYFKTIWNTLFHFVIGF